MYYNTPPKMPVRRRIKLDIRRYSACGEATNLSRTFIIRSKKCYNNHFNIPYGDVL
jgi:hypothetical protein